MMDDSRRESDEALPRDSATTTTGAEDIRLNVLSSGPAPSVTSDYPQATESFTSTSKLQFAHKAAGSRVDVSHFDPEGIQELHRKYSQDHLSGQGEEQNPCRASVESDDSGTVVGSLHISDPDSFELEKWVKSVMKR